MLPDKSSLLPESSMLPEASMLLAKLSPLPPDPILGITVACRNDPNPKKVDLGVGVYKDPSGHTPIMAAVTAAQKRLLATEDSKTYVSPPGNADYLSGVTNLVFGEHQAVTAGRVAALQTPAGSGALRVIAGVLLRADENATVHVPAPTWGNHTPLLGQAGLTIEQYPYYNRDTHEIEFEAMVGALNAIPAGDVVLFHGCCHNPCGADLSPDQWDTVAQIAVDRGFIPFVDMAYQGLGRGIDADAYGIRTLAHHCDEVLLAYSTSKNFGLYRERAGVAFAVTKTPETAATVTSQLANVARTLWSMPPSFGASVVGIILNDPDLSTMWETELTMMRERITAMRELLAVELRRATGSGRFDFITAESGMFSFLGITADQVTALQRDHSVYAIPSSRINIAGLSEANCAYVADAIAAVIK